MAKNMSVKDPEAQELVWVGIGEVRATYPTRSEVELHLMVPRGPDAARAISLLAPGGGFDVYVALPARYGDSKAREAWRREGIVKGWLRESDAPSTPAPPCPPDGSTPGR